MSGALLVAGTHSDAGKTTIVAGLCRLLARRGIDVAPFKAQNMALNSTVTADGCEIGRAQAMQAAAARIDPTALMNPVLLKPASDTHAQVIVLGRPWADADALGYQPMKETLREIVLDALSTLRRQHDVVICEGAGSPAEINLRADDLANMGLARGAGLPVLLAGDVDRGGLFASMFGTLALLDAEDQRHVAGYLVNKFRGDAALLAPGLAQLTERTGRPFLGVLPWLDDLWLDGEDSLGLSAAPWSAPPPTGDVLRVACLRFPRLSNYTDLDAIACEPGVIVRLVTRPEELADADLVVLPGTRSTVSDLAWLRGRGFEEAIARHVGGGRALLGICGGYQMLGAHITDGVESSVRDVDGLGLLPVRTTFASEKTLRQRVGHVGGDNVRGYEIRYGQVAVHGGRTLIDADDPDGCIDGGVTGTSWHGLLESDAFRRRYLTGVAHAAGRSWSPGPVCFAEVREHRLDRLGDLVADHLDVDGVLRLLEQGTPRDLPVVRADLLADLDAR